MQRQHTGTIQKIIRTLKVHSHKIVELLDPPSNILQDYVDPFHDENIISIQPCVAPPRKMSTDSKYSSRPTETTTDICSISGNMTDNDEQNTIVADVQTVQENSNIINYSEEHMVSESIIRNSPERSSTEITNDRGDSVDKICDNATSVNQINVVSGASENDPLELRSSITDPAEMLPSFGQHDSPSLENYKLVNSHYQCGQCGAKFKQKRTIRQHMKKHAGVYEHTCEFCGKSFACSDSLRRHTIVHATEKSLACSVADCSRTFKLQSQLKEHMKRVHGEKSHVCSYAGCNQAFALARELKCHSNVHQGTFKCNLDGCSRRFRDRYNLQCHMRTHSGEKTVKCSLCPYSCIQKASLNWHMKTKHSPGETP